jgi:hypothetical protein
MIGTDGEDAVIDLSGRNNAADTAKQESVAGGNGCIPLAPERSRLVAHTPL